jgi:protein-tyrosine phosphatase
MNKIDNIIGTHLYISDYQGASNHNQLLKNKIKHIFNFSSFKLPKYEGIVYHDYPIYDSPDQNILIYFREVINKIDKSEGNILINCQAGISRSASMAIAYLMSKGFTFNQSYGWVRASRNIINPNQGFMNQLIVYESVLARGHN